jgi:hypothetical protein
VGTVAEGPPAFYNKQYLCSKDRKDIPWDMHFSSKWTLSLSSSVLTTQTPNSIPTSGGSPKKEPQIFLISKRSESKYEAVEQCTSNAQRQKVNTHIYPGVQTLTAPCHISQKEKTQRSPSTHKKTNKIWYTSQQNTIWLYKGTWMNLENVVLSERSQTENTTYCFIYFRDTEQTNPYRWKAG